MTPTSEPGHQPSEEQQMRALYLLAMFFPLILLAFLIGHAA